MTDPVKVDLPPLHPDRIADAITGLGTLAKWEDKEARALESGIAALKLIQKSQHALNLTGDTATAIGKAREFLAAVVKLTQR